MHALLRLLLILTVTCASLARAELLDDIRSRQRIRVGIAVGVPQFSFLDAQQRLTGSDYDTAQLLAKDMGVQLEVVRLVNAERIKAIENGTVDIVVSSLSITPERERMIDFSVPYAKLFTVVAAPPRISIRSYADLARQRIGATRLTSNAALIEQFAPEAQIVGFDDDAGLIQATVDGKVELISTQQAVVDEINRRNPKLQLEEKFVQREFDLGIGLPKHQKGLRDWLNRWVGENLRNGQLNALYRRHHGRDLPPSLRPTN